MLMRWRSNEREQLACSHGGDVQLYKWEGGRGATNVSADMLLSDRTCDKCCRSNLLVLFYDGGRGVGGSRKKLQPWEV